MTLSLPLIAKTGFAFSNPYILISVIIIGLLNRQEKIYGRVLFLLLFTIIYNLYLKSLWQHPLPPPLEGWAFPSGHMHSAVVFWGWLAIEYRRLWFSAIVGLILCLVAYGLLYSGYHYPIDIVGSLAVGALSLFIYYFVNRLPFFKESPYQVGVLLTLLGFGIMMLIPPEGKKLILWQAWGTLAFISLGWLIPQRVKTLKKSFS